MQLRRFKELDLARSDLRASIILHKNKLYPQSIWCLEQGIEKTFKFFGNTIAGLDDKYYANKVSHKPSKIYREVYDRLAKAAREKANMQAGSDDLKQIAALFSRLQEERADSLQRKADDSTAMDQLDISDDRRLGIFIETFYKFFKPFEEGRRWPSHLKEMDRLHKIDMQLPDKDREYVNGVQKDTALWYIVNEFNDYSESLAALSRIAEGPASKSRYIKNGESPLDLFKKETPVVRYTPNLVATTLKIIFDLEELMNAYYKWAALK